MKEAISPTREVISPDIPPSAEMHSKELEKTPRQKFSETLPNLCKKFINVYLEKEDPFRRQEKIMKDREKTIIRSLLRYLVEETYLLDKKAREGDLNSLDQSSLRGYTNQIEKDFGQPGTPSGKIIDEIRQPMRELAKNGLTIEQLRNDIRYSGALES